MKLEYIKNDFRREHGLYVCPFNQECRCERLECYKCGWNPKVEEERKKAMAAESKYGKAR